MPKQMLLNAFSMNCVAHQSSGLWRHPRDRSREYTSAKHWQDLARTLERGLFDGIFLADVSGVYHLTAAGRTSWHGFADAIIGRGEQKPKKEKSTQLVAIATSEYPTLAIRPAWSVLDNSKLKETFGIAAPDWRSQLDLCLNESP